MAREAAPLLDRFRRMLFPGVKVEFHPRLPIVYDVADVRPVVDPRQPAGLWQMTLTATVSFNAFGGTPIEELTAVVYPKPVSDAAPNAQKSELPAQVPKQDDDSVAGADEYHHPDAPPKSDENEPGPES